MLVICGAYSVSAMLDILTLKYFKHLESVCIVNGLHATVRDFDNWFTLHFCFKAFYMLHNSFYYIY